jgi:integrase
LQSFSDRWGKLTIGELRKHHVETWLAEKQKPHFNGKRFEGWGPGTCRTAIAAISAALRWAEDTGLIAKNPVAKLKRPAARSRSVYCVVTDEQHAHLIAEAEKRSVKGFRDILTVLYETGARPGEVRLLEARHYRPDQGAWVIDACETGGNNKLGYAGRRRVIYLTSRLVPLVEELNALHPTGPIFPNENGRAFTKEILQIRFGKTRKRCGIPKTVTLYGYRHKFATDWLAAGKSPALLAELLGTSIAMLQKHYSHLTEQGAALRAALADFKPGDAATPSSGSAASV